MCFCRPVHQEKLPPDPSGLFLYFWDPQLLHLWSQCGEDVCLHGGNHPAWTSLTLDQSELEARLGVEEEALPPRRGGLALRDTVTQSQASNMELYIIMDQAADFTAIEVHTCTLQRNTYLCTPEKLLDGP